MPISVNQNLNRAQSFKSVLSPLNSAQLQAQNATVQNNIQPAIQAQNNVSAPAMINPGVQKPVPMQQNQDLQNNMVSTPNQAIAGQNSNILKPNSAYMPGVGTVPSGYFIKSEEGHGNEDHIIKKTPLTGAKIMADKITKDIFVYAPKGMQGSKNSNFYEFLSLGIIPYIVGSAGLIATSVAASKFFNPNDTKASRMMAKNTIAGVLLYAGMKWLGSKVINAGTKALTGVDMEMPYKKVISELPENGQEKVVTEFHKVFESVDFPRWDLINKQGEEHGNRYEYYDNIAKDKLGCEEPLNAPDQVVQPLIKQALTKAMAAKSIASFLWAATGVAIAAQKPFSEFMSYQQKPGVLKVVKDFVPKFTKTFAESAKQLWKGSNTASSVVGKTLIIATGAVTALGLANVKRGYKIDKEPSKSKIDYTKDYMEN